MRVAFDVEQPGEESGLVRAIEEGGEAEASAPTGTSRPSARGWLAVGLFLAALAVGFLLVWLLG